MILDFIMRSYQSSEGLVEDSFRFIIRNKYSCFVMVWRLCFLLLVILSVVEAIRNKILERKNINEAILYKIMLSISPWNNVDALHLIHNNTKYVNCAMGEYMYTPFLLACYHGNTPLVKYMLSVGADIKSKTSRGESPFFLAVAHLIKNPFSVDATCIRELFYAGCNINEPNIKGYTPLHLAAAFGHRTLIKWLLEKGANAMVLPSPVQIASSRGHFQAASLISNWENKRKMITQ
ncbi:hypothetical protein WA026_016870 [Henosepilachna vigintioctopunctata]|uniref:Ankyrin repeat protein n=1 Tax=Henosepilachna vigintioctopunctata TaxID=420089 RepID=A0AAW1UCY9_9CUCU